MSIQIVNWKREVPFSCAAKVLRRKYFTTTDTYVPTRIKIEERAIIKGVSEVESIERS